MFFSGNGEFVQLFTPLPEAPATIECHVKVPKDGGGVIFSDADAFKMEGCNYFVLL